MSAPAPLFLLSTVMSQYKKKDHCMEDLSSVNQVLNMITITSGNFFNTDCDAVDYLTAQILSYLTADLND
jgi:hypothetical protein